MAKHLNVLRTKFFARFCGVFFVVAFASAFSSCRSSRSSLSYFEDLKFVDSIEYNVEPVRIVPNDELFISVTSFNPEATSQYNLPLVNVGMLENLNSPMSQKQQTFIVDSNGYINFPVLGKLEVKGMTTGELTEMLFEKISRDVTDPVVRVELVNFNIDVLGEVRNPGRYKVESERVTLLDAIAMAGDLTEYGERGTVLLIREADGKRIMQRLDLNDSKLLSSPYFYLRQNDAVYVEPNEIRKENSKYNQNNAFKLSVTSTVVSTLSVIASLVIALAVK